MLQDCFDCKSCCLEHCKLLVEGNMCYLPARLPLRLQDANLVMAANTAYDFERVAEQLQHSQPMLAALLAQLGQDVEGAAAARQALTHVVSRLREMDVAMGGGHTRAADILQLYAATQVCCEDVCAQKPDCSWIV
jgi:hypothetical protein